MRSSSEAREPAADEESLARLSRFEAGEFRPVPAGGIDTPFVHVFVHGWQPGYRVRERLLAMTDAVPAVHAWDPRLVDGSGRPLISDYLSLLEALAALGEDHAVLWYSWLDESATDADVLLAYRSRQATQVNGRRLAVALQQAMATPAKRGDGGDGGDGGNGGDGGRGPRLHLIGHSHGSAVATHAAVSLGRAPEQLTILDAPESQLSRVGGAADLIDVVLPRLRPGRGPGRVFIDSYVSAFGRPYHRRPGLQSVVDVQLAPPLTFGRDPLRAISVAHLYAVEWYARSVREQARGVGYGWSPLRGADVSQLRRGYRVMLPNRPLDLRPRRELGRGLASGLGTALGLALGRHPLRAARTRRRVLDGLALELTVETPAAAAIVHSEPGDQLIEFDLVGEGGDGSERVELSLDGVPAFIGHRSYPVPMSGRYVMLADGRPGEHLLTARLSGASMPGRRRAGDPADRRQPARARVTGLRMVNRPGAGSGFSMERSVGAVFAAGAVSGGLATLVVLAATGLTARKVLAVITRWRRRTLTVPAPDGRVPGV